jgi:hypothetical protein
MQGLPRLARIAAIGVAVIVFIALLPFLIYGMGWFLA